MKRYVLLLTYLVAILTPPLTKADEIIEMRKEASGIYTLPCEVNGLKLRFILDTGASSVSISLTEATFMLKNGYLSDTDIIGTTNIQTADGRIAENYTIKLNEVKIGSVILKDVDAVVSNGLDAPLLLGQSVLKRLGSWSVHGESLILNESSGNDDETYTWDQIEQMLKKGDKTRALNYLRPLIQENNDYAAYIFLRYISPDSKQHPDLTMDNEVTKSLEILTDVTEEDLNELYFNFERAIWFSLYRLGNIDLAMSYLNRCEQYTKMDVENLDNLAYSIMLSSLYSNSPQKPIQKITKIANGYFAKKYHKAYLAYANYLGDALEMPVQSFNAHKKSAEAGYIPGKIKLGIDYLYGKGTAKNISLGLQLLESAANNGYIEAICSLCEAYYYGHSVKQNYDKVLKYAKLFGENNDACAILKNAYTGLAYYKLKNYLLANHYLFNEDVKEVATKPISPSALSAWNDGICVIGEELLFAMGEIYEKGLGIAPSFEKAFEYYSLLAESNPAWGYEAIGDLLFLNELYSNDSELAYQYYVLGANNGSPYCAYRLALMNYYGVGTVKNTVKANEYKYQAISGGIAVTAFNF